MEVVQMQNAPTISQNYRYNGSWSTLSLTEEEISQLKKAHREYTSKVMAECIVDAMDKNSLESCGCSCVTIAVALFEARVDKFFTWVMRALQDKTRRVRGNGEVVIEEERVCPSSLKNIKTKLLKGLINLNSLDNNCQ
jgi:hypothetical protein